MTRFRDAKECNNWLQIRIDDHRIQSDYKYKKWTTKCRRTEICTWYCVCVVKPSTTPMTTWPPRPRTPSTQRTWTLTRECAVLFVSQVRVVMIHIALHGSRVLRTSSHPCMKCAVLLRPWILHSLLLPHHPIHPLSPALPSCTSSTTLRAVATLCTPLERRWTLLTTPPSSQVMSATPTTSKGDLRRVLHRVPDQPTVLQARVFRGRGVRWHRTRGYASRSTPSTCLSLPARRLVCRSVVVICVRKNGATCWRANGSTCWIDWSGAKRCKCTD